jgi:hypothetical protein
MSYISNIPDVQFTQFLAVPIPDALYGDFQRCVAYNGKVRKAYFQTSIACRLFNLHYSGVITIEEWEGETQKYLWKFALEHQWEFIE